MVGLCTNKWIATKVNCMKKFWPTVFRQASQNFTLPYNYMNCLHFIFSCNLLLLTYMIWAYVWQLVLKDIFSDQGIIGNVTGSFFWRILFLMSIFFSHFHIVLPIKLQFFSLQSRLTLVSKYLADVAMLKYFLLEDL